MKIAKTHYENVILPAATVHFSRNISCENLFDEIFTKIIEIADAKSSGTLSMEIAIRDGKNRKMAKMS